MCRESVCCLISWGMRGNSVWRWRLRKVVHSRSFCGQQLSEAWLRFLQGIHLAKEEPKDTRCKEYQQIPTKEQKHTFKKALPRNTPFINQQWINSGYLDDAAGSAWGFYAWFLRFLCLVFMPGLFLGASAVHCCCFEFRLTAFAVLCEKAGSKLPRATMSTGGDQLWSALIHGVKNFSLCLAVYSAFHTHYRKRKGLWEEKLKTTHMLKAKKLPT